MAQPAKQTARFGVIVGVGLTIWSLIERAQSVEHLWQDRHEILKLLQSNWFGPTIVVVSLIAYWTISRREAPPPAHFSGRFFERPSAPVPPKPAISAERVAEIQAEEAERARAQWKSKIFTEPLPLAHSVRVAPEPEFLDDAGTPNPRFHSGPNIQALAYTRTNKIGSAGFDLKNDSLVDAYQVSIPPFKIGDSTVTVNSEQEWPCISKADGIVRLEETWTRQADGTTTFSSEDGGIEHALKGIREPVPFVVRYRDGHQRWYQTDCVLERDVVKSSGVNVRTVGVPKRIPKP